MNTVNLIQHTEVSRVPISKDNRRVYVTLPGEVVEKLEAMAKAQMRSLSSMTALMVIRGLEAQEEKDAAQKGGK